jgi:PAS domain S-box-containing protein
MEYRKKNRNQILIDFIRMLSPSLVIFTVFMVMIFAYLVPSLEKNHLKSKEDQCRHLVEIVINYLASLNSDVINGKVGEREAKDRALERIRSFRFGNDTKDYFWILDKKGIVIMHPFRRDIENINPDEVTGPDGEILMKLMIRMSDIANSAPDGGAVSYIWNRRDEITKLGNKVAYLKNFEPWGWIIGTGVYIDEAESEIRSWKRNFISAAILLSLFSAAVSMTLSVRAGSSRRKEEKALILLQESEKNLRMREELFRSIFEKSPHGIVITDVQSGRVINANRAFSEITGFTIENLISDIAYPEIQPLTKDEKEKFTEEIKSKGVVENLNSYLLTEKRIKRDIIYSAILINYMDEESILRMIVDITDEKILEEKLRHSQKMDVIGRLAGGIAHDFNNMLGVIIGSAELLSLKIDPQLNNTKYIKRILETGEKATALIKKLMLFSRKSGAVFRIFDIHETISNVTDILEHTIDKKVSIELNLKAVNSTINGDPDLIENALLNMALNSRDAMPDGGKISFRTENRILDEYFVKDKPFTITPGNYIEIEISDTGYGISPEYFDKIFEPFFTTKPSGKGTGLGLAAVYGTVKEHSGTIALNSEPGKGSVFKIYLPCRTADNLPVKQNDSPLFRGSENILIIDDDINILANLKDILAELGYGVHSASGGLDGINIFRENFNIIDLVIVDMIMPDISGLETIIFLKDIRPDIKIVVSSGFNNEETTGRLSNLGISGFIQKPFRIDELSRLLHSLLRT